MKCYYHNDRDGVGQCKHCGKVLCRECMDIYRPPLCSECAEVQNNTNKENAKAEIILSIVAMVVAGIICISSSEDVKIYEVLITMIIMGGVPYGWSALNKITPSFFLILPAIGWVFYFVFKFAFSALIGWFILPIKMVRNIKKIKTAKSMEEYIKQKERR